MLAKTQHITFNMHRKVVRKKGKSQGSWKSPKTEHLWEQEGTWRWPWEKGQGAVAGLGIWGAWALRPMWGTWNQVHFCEYRHAVKLLKHFLGRYIHPCQDSVIIFWEEEEGRRLRSHRVCKGHLPRLLASVWCWGWPQRHLWLHFYSFLSEELHNHFFSLKEENPKAI